MGKDTIGKNVLNKITPSKVEIALNLPPNLLQLKVIWEKEENRALSEEELQKRYLIWLLENKAQRNEKKGQRRIPSNVNVV